LAAVYKQGNLSQADGKTSEKRLCHVGSM